MVFALLAALAWSDDVPATPAPVAVEGPLLGLADLHVHQWAELAYNGRFYYGKADGPPQIALGECGDVTPQAVPPKLVHGRISTSRQLSKMGMKDERSDDVRPRHPPAGISAWDQFPNWLGWPTSDSVAHQQAWDGWIRLAHDGVPFVAWMAQHPGDSAREATDDFYAGYLTNMRNEYAAGAVGVNLMVVSLVNNSILCRQQVLPKALRDNPALCNDMDMVKRQYDAALYWAEENRGWVEIATTPHEADQAIRAGKLAIVLSIEVADLFGPSETVGVDGQFEFGYRGRARQIAGAGPLTDQAVTQALSDYLDAFPKVATLQITHQNDSPFAGAAYIVNTFVQQQRWRDRHVADVPDPRDPTKRYSCREAASRWKWHHDEGAPYPECEAASARRGGSPGIVAGLDRFLQATFPRPFGIPPEYRRAAVAAEEEAGIAEPKEYRNPYGLSPDGRLLVAEMMRRGMPVDLAHLSHSAFDEVIRFVDDAPGGTTYPLYSSHTYPQAADVLQREQNLGLDQLAVLAHRGAIVGVRPGDDETRYASVSGPFAEVLAATDCMGTSVGSGLLLSSMRDTGVHVAWGTDLNGFINQAGPTGQLRPPTWQTTPCAAKVPSIGSEVAQRGLAHVGLLPQLTMEAAAVAASRQGAQAPLPEAIDDALHASGHFVASWATGWCAATGRFGPQSDDDRAWCSRRTAVAAAPAPAAWSSWRSWLGIDEPGDPVARVSVAIPDPGGQVPPVSRLQAHPSAKSRKHPPPPLDEQAEGEVGVDLPRWRAAEAILPYYAARQTPGGPRISPYAEPPVQDQILPQFPTSIGFLVGAYTYEITPSQTFFPYRRCVWSGTLSRDARLLRRPDCRQIRDARRQLGAERKHPWTDPDSGMDRPLARWDRIYAGPLVDNPTNPFDELSNLPYQLNQLPNTFATSFDDWPAFRGVSAFVQDEAHQSCLKTAFLTAPVPGLPAGSDPASWLSAVGDDREAEACYCQLLRDLPAGVLRKRDQAALDGAICSEVLHAK